MSRELSAEAEQYLDSVVAGGLFPTRQAALEAAVRVLRAATEAISMVPPEHIERVEGAIQSTHEPRPPADADWEKLRQFARDVASDEPRSRR